MSSTDPRLGPHRKTAERQTDVPRVDAHVRLRQAIPELDLRPGEAGVVRSVWFAPNGAYEVEFPATATRCCVRTLLRPDQVDVIAAPQRGPGEPRPRTLPLGGV